jgi:hypothetical protein
LHAEVANEEYSLMQVKTMKIKLLHEMACCSPAAFEKYNCITMVYNLGVLCNLDYSA